MNAMTCLVSAAGYCLEPGARQLAVRLRGGSPGSQWDTSCRESCWRAAVTACSCVNLKDLEPKIISSTQSEIGQDAMS